MSKLTKPQGPLLRGNVPQDATKKASRMEQLTDGMFKKVGGGGYPPPQANPKHGGS